ncbi:MAG: Uma2 family endonuclease [Myxococcota bacterium]
MYVARHHEFSLAEYFAAERRAGDKHEYADGQIYVMAGGSPRHNHLAGQVYRLLAERLAGGPCAPLTADQRIATPDGLYTYADASVFCGPIRVGAEQTALNPAVVVEVLSDSTRAYDRGEKLRRYPSVASLQHVVLMEQDAPDVEVWSRQAGGWVRAVHTEADAVVVLAGIGVTLGVGELYAGAERFPG